MNSHHFKRRDLILGLSALGLAGIFGKKFYEFARHNSFEPNTGSFIMGGGSRLFAEYTLQDYYPHTRFTDNVIFRLDTNGSFDIAPTLSQVHDVMPWPLDLNLIMCTSRKSDRIFLYDIKNKREVSAVLAPPGHYYYGHAAFTSGGRQVVATVVNGGESAALVYDLPDLKLQQTIKLGSNKSHDIMPLAPDKFLLAGSNTILPEVVNFTILNTSSETYETLSHKITDNPAVYFSSNHMHRHGSHVYTTNYVLQQNNVSGVSFLTFNTENNKIDIVAPFGITNKLTELLNIKYDPETNYLWMNAPDDKVLLVWDVSRDTMVKILKFDIPGRTRTISLVPKIDSVIVGLEDTFQAFHRKTLERQTQIDEKWQKHDLTGYFMSHSILA